MKKFLATILAMAMCISLFPAAYAEGDTTTATGGYEYVFTSAAYGQETDINRTDLAEKALTDISASASDPWRGVGTYYVNNLALYQNNLCFSATSNRIGTTRIIFEVSVPDGGKYIPKLTYTANKTSPIVDVYLGEKPDDDTVFTFADTDWDTYNYVQNVLTADDKLDTVDMYPSDGVEGTKTATFGERTLSAGSYYLCFYVSGENSPSLTTDNTTTFGVYLESFELELVPEDNLLSLELSSTSNSVKVNETATLTATAIYSLSGKNVLSEGVEYVSSDSAVAEVSSDGVVTGKKRGTAKITATVTGTEISASVDITVTSAHEYEYVFTASAYGVMSGSVSRETLATKTLTDIDSSVSDQWRGAGTFYFNNFSLYQNNLCFSATSNRIGTTRVVFEVSVPDGGTFVPSFTYEASKTTSPIVDVYFAKKPDDATALKFDTNDINVKNYMDGLSEADKLGTVNMYPSDGVEGTKTATFNERTLTGGTYYLSFFVSGKDDRSSLTTDNSTTFYVYLNSFALDTVESEPSEIEKAFDYAESNHTGTGNTSVVAYAVYGTDGEVVDTQTIATPAVTYGSTCEISAPATYTDTESGKTYSFLYWAKGMTMGKKQVVSYAATIPEYRPHEGVNYLIAVYEEDGANANIVEFYNANGQLLDLALTDENKLPDLPSMAGYGKAVKWALRNEDGTYTEYEKGADASNLSGVFMAKYNDLKKDIEVTVNGGEPTYYAYGDSVSCTTDAENFSYWTKTVSGKTEIVSTNKEYTFNAYEACTVTAVCNGAVDLGKTMRKIILSTFTAGDETAVMAEFIGFEDALEKGIMFGTQKIAMNTDKTQLTVINDANGTTNITGYAIINDGALKKITDGELTVGAE